MAIYDRHTIHASDWTIIFESRETSSIGLGSSVGGAPVSSIPRRFCPPLWEINNRLMEVESEEGATRRIFYIGPFRNHGLKIKIEGFSLQTIQSLHPRNNPTHPASTGYWVMVLWWCSSIPLFPKNSIVGSMLNKDVDCSMDPARPLLVSPSHTQKQNKTQHSLI